jgi:hypothetical protein
MIYGGIAGTWGLILTLTRVELDNALDLGLRIGGRGRRINSKVEI